MVPRNEQVSFSLSHEAKLLIEQYAEQSGLTISDYLDCVLFRDRPIRVALARVIQLPGSAVINFRLSNMKVEIMRRSAKHLNLSLSKYVRNRIYESRWLDGK